MFIAICIVYVVYFAKLVARKPTNLAKWVVGLLCVQFFSGYGGHIGHGVPDSTVAFYTALNVALFFAVSAGIGSIIGFIWWKVKK